MDNTYSTHKECVFCNNCLCYDECKDKGCLIWCDKTCECDILNHDRPCAYVVRCKYFTGKGE